MKFYSMPESDQFKGVCWKYALACMLGVNPKKVPHLAFGDMYGKTRKWLKEKHKKGIAYIPINQFMENAKLKYNPHGGPDGYSIMMVETTTDNLNHVVIAKDGKFCFDPGDIEKESITHPVGFFVLYDL